MPATLHRKYEKPKLVELLDRLPTQGHWTEAEYLSLDGLIENQRSIELVDGALDFLPMPTGTHEAIVAFLYEALRAFTKDRKLGIVNFSGRRIKSWNLRVRLPDIIFLRAENRNRAQEDYIISPDLVMEVVSPTKDDRDRDYFKKRREYAKAGIPEYWIVDPQAKQITVLSLDGKTYKVHGKFVKGQKAASFELIGFEVDVTEVLAGLKQ